MLPEKKKQLYFVLDDLEKTFERVKGCLERDGQLITKNAKSS